MKPAPSQRGFTLTELLVAGAVSSLLVLSLVSMFVQHRKSYKSMQLMTEMNQNLRVALDTVARDLRMAGHGMNVRNGEYASWMSWAGSMTSAVRVVQGASGAPDTLTITGALEDQGALSAAVTNGATSLSLGSGQGSLFDTGNRRIILVGKTETARVTGKSGDTLTISTDPVTSGRGLVKAYRAGAPVELVRVITYSIRNDPGSYPYMPFLHRVDSGVTATYDWQRMSSCGIEDLQVSKTGQLWTVSMTAKATQRDPNYLHPVKGDRFRRYTVVEQVRVRKPGGI